MWYHEEFFTYADISRDMIDKFIYFSIVWTSKRRCRKYKARNKLVSN